MRRGPATIILSVLVAVLLAPAPALARVPSATGGLRTPSRTASTVVLAWNAAARASSYHLQLRVAGSRTWRNAATTPSRTRTVKGLVPATAYEFRVHAHNASGTGSWSAPLRVSTPPAVPAPKATVFPAGFSLSWAAVRGATSYRVRYRAATSGTWDYVATRGVSASLPGTPGVSYGFQVQACGAGGWGGYSAPATVSIPVPENPVAALGFPRLAVWWPNNDKQPVADRARYDWIEMQWYDADHIPELRAANPDIVLLSNNNARELNYSLTDYNEWTNREMRSASTDWLITQAGSTLTSAVTSSATSIPVGNVSLFSAGQMVLVDHELMSVRSVGTSSLTVAPRGMPMPAMPHAAGARIAATVSLWPGALEYNVTANCPKVDVGDGNGPETWNQWNVQRAKNEMAKADWDGIMVDCDDGNDGWWVDAGYAQSFDLNRDNVPEDPHTVIDPAWNAGMVEYSTLLRAGLGPDAIIVANGAVRNYALNGKNWENWPNDDTAPSTWKTVVFGPYGFPNASYTDWNANATAPNLSTIQTYEYDNDIPAGTGWNDPANLYSGFPPPGFVPNYQKMRYGLCTALMGDGFYSYELTTHGHACRALFWFDEYDNAGTQRGYLGLPQGPATAVAGTPYVYRRDYQGGIVLVNPDTVPRTVALGGTFRKIRGTQDPAVNDGSTVTSVTLRARDGIVLLRP